MEETVGYRLPQLNAPKNPHQIFVGKAQELEQDEPFKFGGNFFEELQEREQQECSNLVSMWIYSNSSPFVDHKAVQEKKDKIERRRREIEKKKLEVNIEFLDTRLNTKT